MEGVHCESYARRIADEDESVSEIIGVVMLLAMVISILGLVLVALQPYVNDFDDNKNWSVARVTAEQIQDRINLVGSAANGTGMAFTIPLISSSLGSMGMAETWTIQADLEGYDRVFLSLENASLISLYSQNETASLVTVEKDGLLTSYNLSSGPDVQIIDINRTHEKSLIINVYNSEGENIHRYISIRLSGIILSTRMNVGTHSMALINSARLERMPNEQWTIETWPKLRFEVSSAGQQRVALTLTDIEAEGSMPSGNSATLELLSKGPTSLFDEQARNLRFSMVNDVHEIITPQYISHWSGDYSIHNAISSSEEYHGFGPWQRQSGSDGLTLFPSDNNFLLQINLQQVEVIG
jgi:flagellin-like protein